MSYIPNEVVNLIHEYMNKYKKRPKPYNEEQWKDFDEYKEYLQKELKKLIKNILPMSARCSFLYCPVKWKTYKSY